MTAARTAWTAGNGVGFAWTAAFASADLTSMASGSCVLSNASGNPIANQTNLDDFAFFSAEITIGSATPSAGAYIGLWIAILNEDGSTYGDGVLTAGTQKAYLPPWAPAAILPVQSAGATTLMVASTVYPILLPPFSFAWVLYNGTGITFSSTAGNNVAKYTTANQLLNN